MNSEQELTVKTAFLFLTAHIHSLAVKNGFWEDGEKRNFAEALCLIHSEVSEVLEAHRSIGKKWCDKKGMEKFTKIEEEMADIVIRVIDLCEGRKIRLVDAIIAKHKFNETRPYKHGKKY